MDITTAEVYHRTLLQRAAKAVQANGRRIWGWLRSNPVMRLVKNGVTKTRSLLSGACGLLVKAWRFATKHVPGPVLVAKALTTPAIVHTAITAARVAVLAATAIAGMTITAVTAPLGLLPAARPLRDKMRTVLTERFLVTIMSQIDNALRQIRRGYDFLDNRPITQFVKDGVNGAVVGSFAAWCTGMTPIGWAVGIATAVLLSVRTIYFVRNEVTYELDQSRINTLVGDLHERTVYTEDATIGKHIMDMTPEELREEMKTLFVDKKDAPVEDSLEEDTEAVLVSETAGQGPRNHHGGKKGQQQRRKR